MTLLSLLSYLCFLAAWAMREYNVNHDRITTEIVGRYADKCRQLAANDDTWSNLETFVACSYFWRVK